MPTSASRDYELLVADLCAQLAAAAGIDTESIRHDQKVKGTATTNQIDVVWDFRDAAGQARRIIFEARHYKDPIKQGRLHELSNVVRDIQNDERPVAGIMVTTSGYQKGARAVASTYGLLVLEMREPTPADLKDRVLQVNVTLHAQLPVVEGLRVQATKLSDGTGTQLPADPQRLTITPADGSPRPLLDVLWDGELGHLGAPRPPHPVRRAFSPPAALHHDAQWVADVAVVEAIVGDAMAPPVTVVIGGLTDVAYMVRDAVSGARLWLADDGRIWATND